MFTAAEATGLVMATLEGHPRAADPADVVGGALAKILRVLPERPAVPHPQSAGDIAPHEHLERLVAACAASRTLMLDYRIGEHTSEMVVEPWAVVLRHSHWYLLCWSRSRDAQRVLRVDRVADVSALPETFTPPAGIDALRVVEEHFSQGWRYAAEVLVDAPVEQVRRWVPRSFALLEEAEGDRTRMVATTDDPDWYAARLAMLPVPFEVVGSPELRSALRSLAARLVSAASD